jgi:hypothetical protein
MTSKVFYLIISLSIFLVTFCKPAAADEIKVSPACLADDSMSKLVVFTLLNLNYTVNEHTSEKGVDKLKRKQKTTRQIWKIDCSLKTSACSAAMITIDNVERGQKLNMRDMILPESIHIAARTKNVYTIVFGPFITFTVDIVSGRVDYRESGPDVEGRGVGLCH